MSPAGAVRRARQLSFPRVSGDEPAFHPIRFASDSRITLPAAVSHLPGGDCFPTQAGTILHKVQPVPSGCTFSRISDERCMVPDDRSRSVASSSVRARSRVVKAPAKNEERGPLPGPSDGRLFRGKDTDSRAHHARGQRVPQGHHLGHLRALHHRLGRALIALGILETVEACTRASEMVERLDGTCIHDDDRGEEKLVPEPGRISGDSDEGYTALVDARNVRKGRSFLSRKARKAKREYVEK